MQIEENNTNVQDMAQGHKDRRQVTVVDYCCRSIIVHPILRMDSALTRFWLTAHPIYLVHRVGLSVHHITTPYRT